MFTRTAKWWHRLRDADEHKCMFGIMKMHSCTVTASDPAAYAPGARVRPESPSRRVAHFSLVAESPVAAPLLGATRPRSCHTTSEGFLLAQARARCYVEEEASLGRLSSTTAIIVQTRTQNIHCCQRQDGLLTVAKCRQQCGHLMSMMLHMSTVARSRRAVRSESSRSR